MSDHHVTEDRAYARHPRRTGAVLVIGAGAVGSQLADELARLGVSPLGLIDFDILEVENLIRHRLGASYLGQPKALALMDYIQHEFPPCRVTGLNVDFMDLSRAEQVQLVQSYDVVVAATDSLRCQRRINEICIQAEVPAVYPSVWAGPGTGTSDAEVGEILWVLPGAHTPCYACMTSWRPDGGTAEARGGTRADIQVVVLATVWVVASLLDRHDQRAQILDPEQTLILVHGFMPAVTESVRVLFGDANESNLLYLRVPFPAQPCRVCRGQSIPESPSRQSPLNPRTAPGPARPRPRRRNGLPASIMALVCIALAWWGISSRIDSQRQQKQQQKAFFQAEGAALEQQAKAATFDCFVVVDDGGDRYQEADRNARYSCNKIPLDSGRIVGGDSFWVVVTAKGVSYSAANKHRMGLDCTSDHLTSNGSSVYGYTPPPDSNVELKALLFGGVDGQSYLPKKVDCQISEGVAATVINTAHFDLALDETRNFVWGATNDPAPTAQPPTQDQSSPVPVVSQLPSPASTVPIDFRQACLWAHPGKATGTTSGTGHHIVCLDADGLNIGGFSTPTGLTEWCQHLASIGEIPANLVRADDPNGQWVCLE